MTSTNGPLSILACSIAVLLVAAPAVEAASATWNGTNDSLWAAGTNWSATPVPGSGDTATFNNAGNGNTTITVGTISLQSLLFDTASAAAYTLGSGSISLGANGNFTVNSTVTNTQSVSAALSLNGSYTFTNNSTAAGQSLNIGAVSSATSGTKALTVNGAGNTTISGNLSNGSGGLQLTKNGAGTLTLSGATNSLVGGDFAIGNNGGNGGTVRIAAGASVTTTATTRLLAGLNTGNSGAFTMDTGAGTVTFGGNRGSAANYVGVDGGTGTVDVNGGTLSFTGSANGSGHLLIGANSKVSTGTVTISGGTVNVGTRVQMGSAYTGDVAAGWTSNGSGNATLTINSGSLTIGTAGAGDTDADKGFLYLKSPSGGTGSATVNLNGGTLSLVQFKYGSTGSAAKTISFNGGTVQARATTTSFLDASTTLAAVVEVGGAKFDTSTFDITAGASLLHDSVLGATVDGGLTKDGTGRLTLTGANTFTGATTINAGTLQVGNGTTDGSIGTSSSITNNGALIYNLVGNQAFARAISGSGSLTKTGAGTLTLSGTNSYAGTTTISNGRADLSGTFTSDITVAGGANLGGEGSTTGSLTFQGTSTLYFDPNTIAAFGASAVNATGATVTIFPTAQAAATGIVVLSAPGGITGTAGGVGSNFVFTGRGTAYLGGAGGNTKLLLDYTPANLIWRGNDGTNPTFWDVNVTTNWSNAGTPDKFLMGDAVTFDDTAVSYNVVVQGASISPAGITFNNTTGYTVSGGAIGGTGGLVKNGGGAATISSALTFSGGVTVNAGTLTLAAANTFSSGATLNGGTLNINHANALGSSTFTLNGGTIDNTTAGVLTVANTPISINGDFAFAGTRDLNLAGTITLGSAVGASRTITVSSGNLTVSSTIGDGTAAAGITKAGPGTLTLANGSSTFTGDLIINAGTINATGANILGTTSALGQANVARNITVNTGGTLQFGTHDVLGNDGITPVVTVNVNGGTVINGIVGGGKAFTTFGPLNLNGGTITSTGGANALFQAYQLKGAVTSTGDSFLNTTATAAQFNGFHLFNSTNFNVVSGTLTASAPLVTGNRATAGLTKIGAGTMVLASTSNTYTGATLVNEGTVLVSGSITGSAATVSNAGSTLGGTGTVGAVTVNSGAYLQGGDGAAAAGALSSGGDVMLSDGASIKLTLGTGLTHSSLARTGGTWAFDLDQAFSFNSGAAPGTYQDIITGLSGGEAGLASISTWLVLNPEYVGSSFVLDASNNVDLVLVPEPNVAASLLGGLGLMLGLRRRRA